MCPRFYGWPLAWPDGPVVLVQVDNEGSLYFRDGPYDQDYHPDAIAQYRRYLRNRYSSVTALRAAYGDPSTTFEGVEPPPELDAAVVVPAPEVVDAAVPVAAPPVDAGTNLKPERTKPERTKPDRTKPDRTKPDRTKPRTRPDGGVTTPAAGSGSGEVDLDFYPDKKK